MSNSAFQFLDSWQCVTPTEADAVRTFWQREQANVEGEEADRRVEQVLTRVINAAGELIAVSTAESRTIPRLMQPMFYYRCFIAAGHRDSTMVRSLLKHGFEALEPWSRERDFPCIGMLLELENQGFGRALQRARWSSVEFVFIGRSARGLDLRVRYFKGAELKPMR